MRHWSRKRGVLAAVVLVGALVLSVNVLPTAAQEPPPPIAGEPLTGRAVFTDDVGVKIKIKLPGTRRQVVNLRDASRTAVIRFTLQPGARFPWHTHPGPVLVNVVEGELVYVRADDCVERPYAAGSAFVDPGRGNVHTAFNATDGVVVLMATFYGAPEQGPLLIPVEGPADCA